MIETNITIDGRNLTIARVSKNVDEKKKNKKDIKQKIDKRNLYLANEGCKYCIGFALIHFLVVITRNSYAAAGLSNTDLLKREHAQRDKKIKLKNPNFFVSRTRLSIKNLPKDVDEKTLKKICIEATKENDAPKNGQIVKQVKIMRDLDKRDIDGNPRSRGFAFVEFVEHEDALAALRKINNNPDYFGPANRPIVEFSLENSQQLLKLQQRQERQNQKSKRAASTEGIDGETVGETAESGKTDKKKRKPREKRKKEDKENDDATQEKQAEQKNKKQRVTETPKKTTKQPTKQQKQKTQPSTTANSKADKTQPKKKKQKGDELDDFDRMVLRYKHNLFGGDAKSSSKGTSSNKWFVEE